jgi:hypothetical protein
VFQKRVHYTLWINRDRQKCHLHRPVYTRNTEPHRAYCRPDPYVPVSETCCKTHTSDGIIQVVTRTCPRASLPKKCTSNKNGTSFVIQTKLMTSNGIILLFCWCIQTCVLNISSQERYLHFHERRRSSRLTPSGRQFDVHRQQAGPSSQINLDVVHYMTITLLVASWDFVVIAECERRHHVLHFLCYCISPERSTRWRVYSESLFDGLWQLNAVFMSTFPVSGLEFAHPLIAFTEGLTYPPAKIWLHVKMPGNRIFSYSTGLDSLKSANGSQLEVPSAYFTRSSHPRVLALGCGLALSSVYVVYLW